MEITFVIFALALIRGVAAAMNRKPAITTLTSNTPQSLCTTCAYAHIAHGMSERQKLMACTYGGSVRPLKFAVSTCTFYFNRAAIPRMVSIAGFAQPAEAALIQIAAKADR